MRPDFLELAQEFRLFHNLFYDGKRSKYLHFDRNGDESDAVWCGEDIVEIRTDLLQICDTKQMALAVYLDSFRYSTRTLTELDFLRGAK